MKFFGSLLFKVLVAIMLGLLLGLVMPDSLTRIMVTFNSIFGNLLSFSIPLIILGLVTPAIMLLERGGKKLLLLTVAIAYGATIFSGFFTYAIVDFSFPLILSDDLSISSVGETIREPLTPYFVIDIPPIAEVMSTLVFSFILGIGGTMLEKQSALRSVFLDFKQITERFISNVIIPLLPYHIFGLFLHMSCVGSAYPILMQFSKVIAVIFVLHVVLLLLQFGFAGLIVRRNPLKLLRTMMPAYFTALGTQSSAATIPVTLAQTKRNGVRAEIAEFTVPLCATINLSGSTLKIVACAIALMMITGHEFDFPLMAQFIFMLGIVMVAAPGVPGGAIMAALGVLQTIFGFSSDQQSFMIALYIAMDSFGTACNVTGDGSIALIVDKVNSMMKRTS